MGDVIAKLKQALGEGCVVDGGALAEIPRGWSRLGNPLALVKPRSTAEVSTAPAIVPRH